MYALFLVFDLMHLPHHEYKMHVFSGFYLLKK